VRQRARGEGRDDLGPDERGRPEGGCAAARGEYALQRGDLGVQLLGAAQRFCLPVLAVVLRGLPLVRAFRLGLLPLPSGLRLHLALLLALHLSPDADQAT
jgi:hypothetical protein